MWVSGDEDVAAVARVPVKGCPGRSEDPRPPLWEAPLGPPTPVPVNEPPVQRRQREHQEMISNVRRGDTVVMAGGIVGKITKVVDDAEAMIEVAEGVRISSLHRAKGFKEDIILKWLRQAAEHAEELEERLLKDYRIERGQLDALWSYVRNKGQKNTTKKPTRPASSDAQP